MEGVEDVEDAKRVIISHKSKNRQYNGQEKRDKKTNTDPQNTTQSTKDCALRTTQKTGMYPGVLEG